MITEKVTLDCRLRPQIIYLPTNVSGGPPWSQAVFYGPGFPPPVLKADKSPDPMEPTFQSLPLWRNGNSRGKELGQFKRTFQIKSPS